MATVVLGRMVDAIQQITPPEQKGFIRGWHMVDHLLRVRMEWDRADDIILISVDFAKAYDSVLHEYAAPALRYLCTPPSLSRACLRHPLSSAWVKGLRWE